MKVTVAAVLLGAASVNAAAIGSPDFWSELANLNGNNAFAGAGNKFNIGGLLSGNGVGNLNGNSALNGNGNGNVFKGNDVFSGNGAFAGNKASGDDNSADLLRRDMWSELIKNLNGNSQGAGAGNGFNIAGLLSGNGVGNLNGNSALNGNGNGNTFKGNDVFSGNGIFSGNSAKGDGNSAEILRRDFWSEVVKNLNGNSQGAGAGNGFNIGGLLSGNGVGNLNGNSALNGNGNGNFFGGNDVFSGNGAFAGNKASGDDNEADLLRRDVVWLPPTTEDNFKKVFNNGNTADQGSSNLSNIGGLLSGNGGNNLNGNTALSGNGNNNVFKDNNVFSGNGVFSGNSASANNNKIYILPITVNDCKSE